MTETASLVAIRLPDCPPRKIVFTMSPMEVARQLDESARIVLIDVREPAEFRRGHLPEAVNVPRAQWETVDFLRKDAITIVYCHSDTCHLAAQAANFFGRMGYATMEMEGGFHAWKKGHLKVVRESSGREPSGFFPQNSRGRVQLG